MNVKNTIDALIAIARAAEMALDDSCEFEGDDGLCVTILMASRDELSGALDALEDLPDDKPGSALSLAGRASWKIAQWRNRPDKTLSSDGFAGDLTALIVRNLCESDEPVNCEESITTSPSQLLGIIENALLEKGFGSAA